MKSVIKLSAIILSVLLFASCTSQQAKQQENEKNAGVMLLFAETPVGGTTTGVRIYVNDYFMRIDDATTPEDYILFDRKNEVVNSVVSEGKTIFVIKKRKIALEPPISIEYIETKGESAAMTKRHNGFQAFHYKFEANGENCFNVVAVKDYMPTVVEAFKEFRTVMAGEHAKTMSNIPGEEYDACDLAFNIFESTRHLQHGFPVREWDSKGYQRFLAEAKEGILPPKGFLELPEGYRSYSISE